MDDLQGESNEAWASGRFLPPPCEGWYWHAADLYPVYITQVDGWWTSSEYRDGDQPEQRRLAPGLYEHLIRLDATLPDYAVTFAFTNRHRAGRPLAHLTRGNASALIAHLGRIRENPDYYVRTHLRHVEELIIGLRLGAYESGLAVYGPAYVEVARRRGWRVLDHADRLSWKALHRQMRASPAAVFHELLTIEIEAWRQTYSLDA